MLLKFRENFKHPQFAKLRLLRCPHFLRVFLPFVLLGSACGLASGRGSRGYTPLHLAAHAGHDSVVQRLLEAKAAMDVKNDVGRGLGLGLGGNDIMRRGIVVSKWLKYWWFKCFVEIVFTFDGECQPKHLLQHLVLFFVISHQALLFPAPRFAFEKKDLASWSSTYDLWCPIVGILVWVDPSTSWLQRWLTWL